MDLSLRDMDSKQRGQRQPRAGDMVTGRVAAITGGGVRVQLGARMHGRVALTDLHDGWVANALAGLLTSPSDRLSICRISFLVG